MNWDMIGVIVGVTGACIGGLVWLVRLEGKMNLLKSCQDQHTKEIDLIFKGKREDAAELKKEFGTLRDGMVAIQLTLQRIVTHLNLPE